MRGGQNVHPCPLFTEGAPVKFLLDALNRFDCRRFHSASDYTTKLEK
jgi:hypothetical protein